MKKKVKNKYFSQFDGEKNEDQRKKISRFLFYK